MSGLVFSIRGKTGKRVHALVFDGKHGYQFPFIIDVVINAEMPAIKDSAGNIRA